MQHYEKEVKVESIVRTSHILVAQLMASNEKNIEKQSRCRNNTSMPILFKNIKEGVLLVMHTIVKSIEKTVLS